MSGSQHNLSHSLKHKDDLSCFAMVMTTAPRVGLAVHDVDLLPTSPIDDAQKLPPDVGELAVAADSSVGIHGVGRDISGMDLRARGLQAAMPN